MTESVYSYPEGSDFNPVVARASTKTEKDVKPKKDTTISSEVSRGHSKPKTSSDKWKGFTTGRRMNVRKARKLKEIANDCNIYVKSEKCAQRVMESITDYIEKKFKLKVNRTKSKVSRPGESMLSGFSIYKSKERWQIRIAPKSLNRIKKKTRRNNPTPANEKTKKMEAVIRGWVNYFAIAKSKSRMRELDDLVRTRLRIGICKQWKKPKTKRINLVKLGIRSQRNTSGAIAEKVTAGKRIVRYFAAH